MTHEFDGQFGERSDNIIRSMAESLIVVGPDRRIRSVNEATCKMLGYNERELIGRPADEMLGTSGQDRTYRTKQGAEIPVHVSEARLQGAAEERVWMAQDITESKRVQQQLVNAKEAAEEASRAKSLFLANMSHELRTPLNAIIGYSELLGDAALEEDRQTREDLLKIRSAGLHLLGLINEVLDASKMEAGEMTAHAGDFEVEQVVRDVVNTIRPLAMANRNRIEVSGVGDAGTLFTDETKLRQSLLNLMSNACKFTEDGVVSLDMRRERLDGRDSIRIAVKDTGLGIPADEIGKLFQAFHQVDGSQTRKFGGTGLGLSITKSLCEMLGGDIAVASTPGEGSEFTMRLPVELPGIE